MFLLFEDLGFSELVLIGVASVLFFGKRLPEVGRSVGKTVGDLRRQWASLARELGVATRVEPRSSSTAVGSRPSLPAARHDDDASLVAGPCFDPPEGAG